MFAKTIGVRTINLTTAFLLLLCLWLIVEFKLPKIAVIDGFSSFVYFCFFVMLCVWCFVLALYNLLKRD